MEAGQAVWWDQEILPGQDWKHAIRAAMEESYAVVLCLSKELTTRVQSGVYPEVADAIAIERQHAPEKVFLIPVRLSECEIPDVEIDSTRTLRRLQGVDLFPDSRRAEGFKHLLRALQNASQGPATGTEGLRPVTRSQTPADVDPFPPSRLPRTGEFLIGRSEQTARLTTAWNCSKTNVVQIIAPGGVGKTQLVKKWREELLRASGHGGVERAFDWSFYSQGTQQHASADEFFDQALRWFGEADPVQYRDPWAKGTRLSQLVRQRRTLLILDGLEPLQHPPGPMHGELADQAMQSLLRALAQDNPGLCVVTSREAVPDLVEVSEPARITIDLSTLKPPDGAELLRCYGVIGKPEELEQASRDYGGHALALILLGTYLRDRFGGDIVRRDRVAWGPDPAPEHGDEHDGKSTEPPFAVWAYPTDRADLNRADPWFARHARKAMDSYVTWFENEPNQGELREEDPEVARAAVTILRLMGLFNRPADSGCLNALQAEPPISGLTEPLWAWADRRELWEQAVVRLRKARLIADAPTTQGSGALTLDAHPLVRGHFAAQLAERLPAAAREAHRRLYGHLKSVPMDELPDNLNDMMPLYHAVAHGCAGGEFQGAWSVYWERIAQRNWAFARRLAPPGVSLAVLSCFFEAGDFKRLQTRALEAGSEAQVLYEAGHYLFSLGHTREATRPLMSALAAFEELERWFDATNDARILRETHLVRGELSDAVVTACRCLEDADRSGDGLAMMSARAALGQVLDYAGADPVAEQCFSDAEDVEKQRRDGQHRLFYIWAYWMLDFLLRKRVPSVDRIHVLGRGNLDAKSRSSIHELRNLAEESLAFSQDKGLAFDMAHDHQALGTLSLLLGQDAKSTEWKDAKGHFDQAVSLLRPLGQRHHLASALLSRAAWWRAGLEISNHESPIPNAEHDLAEAEQIAELGGMLVWQIEAALERSRLALALGDVLKAQDKLDEAQDLIRRTEKPYEPHVPKWSTWKRPKYVSVYRPGDIVGYHRRDEDINALQQAIDGRASSFAKGT